MNRNDIKLSTCKYQISHLTLSIPGESTPYNVEPQCIFDMYLEQDFDGYLFPYFELTLCLPAAIERIMKKASKDITAALRINYGFYENVMGDAGDKNGTVSKTDWFSNTFYVFMDDCTPDMMEKYKEQYEKETATFKKGYPLDQMTYIKVALYNKDYLFKSKSIVNNVLSDVNVSEAITYVLNSAGIFNVLMSPATNNKKYSQFILTPLTAMEQLERISNEYGIHESGTLVFFDLNRAYILNKTNKNTALGLNETKNIYLMSFQESVNNMAAFGCYKNSIEKYCVIAIVANSLNITAQSMAKDQVFGSNILTVNEATGDISSTTANTTKSAAVNSLNSVIIQKTGEDTTSSLKSDLEESNAVITCNVQGVCLDMLSPNKEFTFTFDSSRFSQYAGNYRLGKVETHFMKEGNLFTPSTNCIFYGGQKK